MVADFSKIGRNNKNRGRAFEKKCAELLGWTRVPYSGGSAEWGGGDVVDGFYSKTGLWSAECKTQQPGKLKTLSIKDKWLRQMNRDCGDRMPVMFVRIVGEGDSFALMPQKSWVFLKSKMEEPLAHDFEGKYGSSYGLAIDQAEVFYCMRTYTLGKGNGFCIKRGEEGVFGYGDLPSDAVMRVVVSHKTGKHGDTYYLMDLEAFADMVKTFNAHKPERKPSGQ